jgi:hypothetical protein
MSSRCFVASRALMRLLDLFCCRERHKRRFYYRVEIPDLEPVFAGGDRGDSRVLQAKH